MSESKLETAEEVAEKWYAAILESRTARFEDTKTTYDCMALGQWIMHKFDLCEAFAAGFVAAMDRQA